MQVEKEVIRQMITQVLQEKLQGYVAGNTFDKDADLKEKNDGVIKVAVPKIRTGEADRLDTGKQTDLVYTHDLFSLTESPRLGCGIMEMEQTTFDWTLDYDEIDYVIEGSLTIIKNSISLTAKAGELILIPKGSKIQFSVPEKARFLYVTYPADWNSQG